MKIKITQDHINEGEPSSSVNCPIACALKEIFPSFEPFVSTTYIQFDGKLGATFVNLPKNAQRFILDFDEYKVANPFEFELDLSSIEHSFDKWAFGTF